MERLKAAEVLAWPHTNSDPRPTKALSMPAYVPSTGPASPAASGPRAISHSRASRALSGTFRAGLRRPSPDPTHLQKTRPRHLPRAAARKIKRSTAKSRAKSATTVSMWRCRAPRAWPPRIHRRHSQLQLPNYPIVDSDSLYVAPKSSCRTHIMIHTEYRR